MQERVPATRLLGRTPAFVLTINLIVCLALLFRPILFFVFGLISDGLNPQIINVDFSNYWFAGKLLSADGPVAVLQHETYFAAARAYFGGEYQWHTWGYPPHFLLLVWPLSFLPYKISLLAFLAGTLLLFVFACRKIADSEIVSERLFWILLVPVVITNAVQTQNGFLTSALLLLAFAYRAQGRYLLAGFFLAGLTIKPQLGVLIPLYLLLRRDWRTILAASAMFAAMVSVSALVFGLDAWLAYLQVTMPYVARVMTSGTGIFIYMMPTFFMAVRSLGFSAEAAQLVQVLVTIPLLALFVYAIRISGNEVTRLFLLAAFTFLVVPYAFHYDLGTLIVLGSVVYLQQRRKLAATAAEGLRTRYADIAIWLLALLPALTTQLALAGAPLGPVIILAATLYFLMADSAGSAAAQPQG